MPELILNKPGVVTVEHDLSLVAPFEASAVFSPCGTFRYHLERRWVAAPTPFLLWVMLNPSTADAFKVDPTVNRCINYAKQWGYGGIQVVNLFAYRSTDRSVLSKVADPVGPLNDFYIRSSAERCASVMCGWGNDGSVLNRGAVVAKMLRGVEHIDLRVLKLTKTGQPIHPLYQRKDEKPQFWSKP